MKPETSGAEWWLQKRGERAATRELGAIFPSLGINARAVFFPGADLEVTATNDDPRLDRRIDVLLTDEELAETKRKGRYLPTRPWSLVFPPSRDVGLTKR